MGCCSYFAQCTPLLGPHWWTVNAAKRTRKHGQKGVGGWLAEGGCPFQRMLLLLKPAGLDGATVPRIVCRRIGRRGPGDLGSRLPVPGARRPTGKIFACVASCQCPVSCVLCCLTPDTRPPTSDPACSAHVACVSICCLYLPVFVCKCVRLCFCRFCALRHLIALRRFRFHLAIVAPLENPAHIPAPPSFIYKWTPPLPRPFRPFKCRRRQIISFFFIVFVGRHRRRLLLQVVRPCGRGVTIAASFCLSVFWRGLAHVPVQQLHLKSPAIRFKFSLT